MFDFLRANSNSDGSGHDDKTGRSSAINVETLAGVSELVSARSYDGGTQIYDYSAGRGIILEILPLVGIDESSLISLEQLFQELGLEDAIIQVLNWSSGRIETPLSNWANVRVHGLGLAKGRIEMFRNAANGSLPLPGLWRPKHTRVFLLVLFAGMKSEHSEKLLKLRTRLTRIFQEAGTQCRSLSPERLLALYKEILFPDLQTSQSATAKWLPLERLNEQISNPGLEIEIRWGDIRFTHEGSDKSVTARCYTSTELPAEWMPGASSCLIGDIFNTHRFCPYPVLQSIILTQTGMNKNLTGVKAARVEQAMRSPLRYVRPDLTKQAEEWKQVTSEMDSGGALAQILMQVVLFSPEDEAEEAEATLRSIFIPHGFNLLRESGFQLPSFMDVLPFGGHHLALEKAKTLRRLRTVYVRNGLTLMPLFGEWRGNSQREPAVMLFAGRRGEVAPWTPYQSDGNYNVSIVGKSGGGKSVAMQELMAGMVATGGSVIVIDDGFSFRNSCNVMGGQHVDLGDPKLLLNPFEAIDAEAMARDSDFAESVNAMLTAFCCALAHPSGEINDLERALIAGAVYETWQTRKAKSRLDDVVALLAKKDQKKAKELVLLLSPFTSKGAYGRLFAGGCNVDVCANLVVFEMSAVRSKTEIQAACMVILIFLATQKMFNSGTDHPVSIMIDEAWSLLSGADSEFVEGVARRARKYKGSFICATQSVEDFFGNPSAQAAWANSDWTLMFKQKDSSIEALRSEKRIVLDDSLERALRSLQTIKDVYSELVVLGGGGWDVCRLPLDQVSITAFSSTGDDVAAIEGLMKNGLTRSEAIHAFTKTKIERQKENGSNA